MTDEVIEVVEVLDADGEVLDAAVEVVEVPADADADDDADGSLDDEFDDEDEEEERPESPFDRPGRWYVVHTYSGYENKVKGNLENIIKARELGDRIHEIVVPDGGRRRVQERQEGHRLEEGVPWLPARALHPV